MICDCMQTWRIVICRWLMPGCTVWHWFILPDVCRAPEQVDADFGLRGTHSDVWGFATCVLHLATGQLPYEGRTHTQMVSAMLKRQAPVVPAGVPKWMQNLLRQCLSFDTATRPSVATLHQVPAMNYHAP